MAIGMQGDMQLSLLLLTQVLPDSLTDAILQASESTITAMQAGSSGIVVRQNLLPNTLFFRFVEHMLHSMGTYQGIVHIYCDA